MGDMGDDFAALREHNRIERAEHRQSLRFQLDRVRSEGYTVQELTEFHWRINSSLDIYTTRARFHDLRNKKRGFFDRTNLIGFVRGHFRALEKAS